MTRLSRTYKTVSLANKTWFTVNKSTTKREKKVIFSRIGENEYIAHHNKNDYQQIKVTQVFTDIQSLSHAILIIITKV